MESDARAEGKALRQVIPRSSHGSWSPAPDRPDPVELIEGQNDGRLADLVPVRRVRMAASPFAFYRGAARIMASDLAAVPQSGLTVQLCGDAHLANFGVYASPGRRLVFDLNDFDETLPGPFEWDVKRLAASFVIAGQHREFGPDTDRDLAVRAARAYRIAMADYATRGWLAMWHTRLPFDELMERAASQGLSKKRIKRGKKFASKAMSTTNLHAASKLVEKTDLGYQFKAQPPLLVPLRDLADAAMAENMRERVRGAFEGYRASLNDQMRLLLDRYQFVDAALKVVGVGSVGTRCWVGLFLGHTPRDVLLLQVKEAGESVLAEHLAPSVYEHQGRRVVEGQRLMQAANDIFLGWSTSAAVHDYYWRQLKDWKGSVDLDQVPPKQMSQYADLCGTMLARAHAVSGHPAVISGYLGRGEVFDEALGDFGIQYAAQNLADYEAFATAIKDGHLEAADLEE